VEIEKDGSEQERTRGGLREILGVKSTVIAAAAAAVILVTVVLPSEYAIDPAVSVPRWA
jgi:hypothetical protein